MRSDIQPGATFPDYELPDHENIPRKLSELQGDDPADPHARARPLLPEGAPAAPRARRVLSEDRRRLHADRHDRDRRAPRAPGVPRVGRRPVALPLRPGAHRPEGPRHPGVHRPRARPDDPAHARAQAGPRHPQHLQRLLVLGPPVGRRPLARPARRHRARSAPTGTSAPRGCARPGTRATSRPSMAGTNAAREAGPPPESRNYEATPSGGSVSS